MPTRKASAPSVKLWRVRSTLAVKIRPGRSATGFLESVREAPPAHPRPLSKKAQLGRGRISSSNRRQTHVRNSPDPCQKISCIDESHTRRLAECAIFSRERRNGTKQGFFRMDGHAKRVLPRNRRPLLRRTTKGYDEGHAHEHSSRGVAPCRPCRPVRGFKRSAPA